MRKIFFLFFVLVTGYLAGVYRYPPLMLLFVMELLLLPVFFFLCRYFRRQLSAEVLRHGESAEREAMLECGIKIKNTGLLPVSRFRIRLRYGYKQEKKRNKKQIYGGSDRGEQLLHFELYLHYCGIVELKLDRLRVYDYLSLFSSSKKIAEDVRIFVFPAERALAVELPAVCYRENDLSRQSMTGQGGDAHNEVRQLREYRPGDSNRYIHWNQSARMDQLWVKEYEREVDYRLELLLELTGFFETGMEELDAFYELLSAVVMGLLRKSAAVRVHWYEGRIGGLIQTEIESVGQCRDMLARLYCREPAKEEENLSQKQNQERVFMDQGSFFKLDLDLNWYWNETLLHQFSRENLEEEIDGRIFAL